MLHADEEVEDKEKHTRRNPSLNAKVERLSREEWEAEELDPGLGPVEGGEAAAATEAQAMDVDELQSVFCFVFFLI